MTPRSSDPQPFRVCFVCLGNICRSPTAEGVMEELVAESGLSHLIEVDSAGTGSWHVGQSADRRASAEARRRGIELTSTARQLHVGDFYHFDLLVAMDQRNVSDLYDLAPDASAREKIHLLRSFDPAIARVAVGDPGHPPMRHDDLDVPDPYYGEGDGFREVFDLVDAACRGLLDHIRTEHLGLPRSDP
jgi:protein-tyrosine phosphatase